MSTKLFVLLLVGFVGVIAYGYVVRPRQIATKPVIALATKTKTMGVVEVELTPVSQRFRTTKGIYIPHIYEVNYGLRRLL